MGEVARWSAGARASVVGECGALSAGASDDGAGCAVLLEVLRALAAARRPLRHDAVFLFNGAEENIMQASHAFITQHKYCPPPLWLASSLYLFKLISLFCFSPEWKKKTSLL